MPMVPLNVDDSTIAITSVITSVITFGLFAGIAGVNRTASLAISIVAGVALYSSGVIPIGLLLVVGSAMLAAIFGIKPDTTKKPSATTAGTIKIDDYKHKTLEETVKIEKSGSHEWGKDSPNAIFIIRNSSLFSKKKLIPIEFGREITRLGFKFGLLQFEDYQGSQEISIEDQQLLIEVNRNSGYIQLLYSNLVTGAFLCYAKVILNASNEVIAEITIGILEELRSTMPEMSNEILEDHKIITTNFCLAIEREIREIEENSSLSYFFHGIGNFYTALQYNEESRMPIGLLNSLIGLGSRIMAICQNDFQISMK